MITKIEDYGYDGEGVGKVNGKVCFVPFTIIGEKIAFDVVKENSTFIKGKLSKVIEKASERYLPRCEYFGRCGGCTYQHLSYENELNIKRMLLLRQLKKVGFAGQIEVIASPQEYNYRNKVRLFVGHNGVGYKERESSNICSISHCEIAESMISGALSYINEYIKNNKLQNIIDSIVIRCEGENGLINFFVKKENVCNYQGIYLVLGENWGIFETCKDKTYHKLGIKELQTSELGLKLEYNVCSFHQVNRYIEKMLYQKVIESVSEKSVVNCYSGAGLLSVLLAKAGKNVEAIELGETEHSEAERLKDKNNIKNLKNHQGDCQIVLPKLDCKDKTIIVDPPRNGMSKGVSTTLNECGARQIIYISCNSASLVRDINLLKNYKLKKVYLFDMFARTGEYECLCLLSPIID